MHRLRLLLLFLVLLLAAGGALAQQQVTDYSRSITELRADLERLADEALGAAPRPDGWTFNINDTGSPTFLADLWFDNELLAQAVFGNTRPPGWIGAPVTSAPLIVSRNIRHDLELTADRTYGPNNRPADWVGGLPLFRCARSVMNQVEILVTVYRVRFTTASNSPNYCQAITDEVNQLTLQEVLSDEEIQAGVPALILAARGDVERLADEELGLNTRPVGWLGTREPEAPTLLVDTILDLELLANDQLGAGQRPPGWLGAPPSAPIYGYRFARFNLELLAEALGRVPRPRGWQGVDPLEQCAPEVQNLVSLVGRAYEFDATTITGADFCVGVAAAANGLVENPPPPPEAAEGDENLFESNIAFSYLDVAATQYMGMMPRGTRFRPWYRNFSESNMMFVSGEDFAVFIDRRWTSMPEDLFSRLPTLEGVKPLTFCDATWCNGPGPTPTPTGGSALELLLNASTPVAAPDPGQLQGQKTLVSWDSLRITYVLDNTATGIAQVAIEICADRFQTACEPATQAFDSATGTLKPVITTFNGLNVYEFSYGYTTGVLIESDTRFSQDIWLSDPTIR